MAAEMFCSCPVCQAVFRLSEEKMNSSSGRVRCGACREVFETAANRVEKTDSGFVLSQYFDREDEITMKDEPIPDPEKTRTAQAEAGTIDQNSGSTDVMKEPYFHDDKVVELSQLESSFDYVSEQNNEGYEGVDSLHSLSESQINALNSPFKESSFESYLDDVDEYIDKYEPKISLIDLESQNPAEVKDEDQRQEDSEQVLEIHRDDPDDSQTELSIDSSDHSQEKSRPVSQYEETPLGRMKMNGVEEYIGERRNPFATFAWFLVALGFVFLLGIQVKYFFVEKYAQHETYRDYLIGFCKIADCELPPRRDPYSFTLTHTKIDLHPRFPGALRVTVKMVNEARFAQPYPSLQLTLTDRVGRVVGRRTFDPSLYLPAGYENKISAGKLGTVVFDLSRPHEKAVGFVVDIVTEIRPS